MYLPCTVNTILNVKYGVALKSWLGVVQGQWKWRRSIDHIRLTIGLPLWP